MAQFIAAIPRALTSPASPVATSAVASTNQVSIVWRIGMAVRAVARGALSRRGRPPCLSRATHARRSVYFAN